MNFAWAVYVASHLVITVQDGVPNFNVKSLCKAEGLQSPADAGPCLQDEQRARELLVKAWTKYPAADRARCVSASSSAGIASYVELLACLDIAKDVKQLPKSDR
jgi:hypothetical protein